MINFLKNYLSTLSIIFSAYFFYTSQIFYQNFLIKNYGFSFIDFNINTLIIFKTIIFSYIILLIPFYLIYKNKSKARIIYNYITKKLTLKNYIIKPKEKMAILAWIVKLFFAPLMIVWLTGHMFNLVNNIYLSYNDIELLKSSFILFFNKHFFWLFFTLILFFDVLLFTIGYLIEIPKLKNKIISVESTCLGWFVVLICYPPFNTYTGNFIGWYSTDFPQFINQYAHLFLNFSILILMGIYSRASIALGLKASNLTNRGIVKKGPYKYIRHPAYFTKNMAWWIGGMPLLIASISSGQIKHSLFIILSLSTWTFIYYLRAITEENHLSSDKDYLDYKKEVKYKFIPKIY